MIRSALQQGQLTGNERFVDEVAGIIGRRLEHRQQGRPRLESENKSVPFFPRRPRDWRSVGSGAKFNDSVARSTATEYPAASANWPFIRSILVEEAELTWPLDPAARRGVPAGLGGRRHCRVGTGPHGARSAQDLNEKDFR